MNLEPIRWGEPDRMAGYMAVNAVQHAMPSTPWVHRPRAYVPRWVGWLAVAVAVLLVLAAFGGRA